MLWLRRPDASWGLLRCSASPELTQQGCQALAARREPGPTPAHQAVGEDPHFRDRARDCPELLSARWLPIPAEPDTARERYWKRTLPIISDLASGAAVGAHAELMRL